MPVPDYQTFILPLLKYVADEPKTFKEICEALAKEFHLTNSDRAEVISSGLATYINRIGWAKTYLKQADLVEFPKKGITKITESGKKVLSNPPLSIDKTYLMQFPSFVAFANKGKTKNSKIQHEFEIINKTPEELIEEAQKEININLIAKLLDKIKSKDFMFFEKLVVDLMLSMGYGGSRKDAGEVVGKSNDKGIDGIIFEDRLGLDLIYLQAKRWEGSVGSETVATFIGSLSLKGAHKGVLITTSVFTKEALKNAEDSKTARIILIDGERLASLMIEYNLGVSIQDTYVIKKIDQDYFEQSE